MSKIPYLFSFNITSNPANISLPNIDDTLLENKSKSRIVIGYDWFSAGSYELGIFTLEDGKIKPIQRCKGVSLVNLDGEYIFEESGYGHKGLCAFQVPDDLVCFALNQDIDSFTGDTDVEIYFEEETNFDIVSEVLRLTTTDKNNKIIPYISTSIIFDKLSITFPEYLELLNNPLVTTN